MAKANEIVLVDDEVAFTEMMATLLETALEIPVRTFNHPRQALDALRTREPLFVVSDLAMPEMDGFEFLHAVARIHPNLPSLLVTGNHVDPDTLADCRPPNLVAVLFKPVSWREIAAQLRAYVPTPG